MVVYVRKNEKHRIWILGLILFYLPVCFANGAISHENKNYRFQYLLTEDGLPQNTITAITKDPSGFMWFGTNNGLCRYDAFVFETFQSDPGQAYTLPENMISSLEPGCDERLWIGTNQGLAYYDCTREQIVNYSVFETGCSEITRVTSIVSQNKTLWVATQGNGIFLLQPDKEGKYGIVEHFCTENLNISSNSVNTVYKSRKNIIYAGSDEGFYIYNPITRKFTGRFNNISYPQGSYVNNIFESSTGDLYVASYNGMALLKNGQTTFEWFYNDPLNNNSLVHNTVNSINEDAKGGILVGSLGGLQSFDPGTGSFYSFPLEGPGAFNLNNKFVSTIYCDSTGNVWVGTEKGGINKFNVYQNQFGFIANDPNNPNSLNENTINSILKEGDTLWIGTAGGGLNRLNTATGKFEHFTNSAFNTATLSSDYITSLIRLPDGHLWAGAWGSGLNRLTTNGNSVKIERISPLTPGIKNDLVNYFVSSLLYDSCGLMLIGTEGGLSAFNYKTSTFTTIFTPQGQTPELSEIGCLLKDSKGNYWAGTRNGLFCFNDSILNEIRNQPAYELKNYNFYSHMPGNTASLPGNYITSLLEDSEKNIWIGTYGKGIAKCRVDENGALICKNYSQNDGLSNNVAYGIQEDVNGDLWISTDYGLSMFNVQENRFRNFFKQDGLLNNQFYWSASHKSPDGTLYFGGTEGLNFFKPENIWEYKHLGTPKITKFRVFNREVKPGDTIHKKVAIEKPVYMSDTILLGYRDNNISFDFSSFDYYLPEKTKFAYKLSGIDKEWIQVNANRRFANYSNLTGGTYRFMLKAANCDGIWNENPTEVTIIITPPFWKTQWFKILLIFFVVLTTFIFIQLQLRRIIHQKKLLEEKVVSRTKKIEEQKIMLEKQADDLTESNHQLERRQKLIEHQKEELERKTSEILSQRDELILLNKKVSEINQHQMQFFTNISHELRTPLTLILSPLEHLIKKTENGVGEKEILLVIERNARRLLMLINQLLEIRKIETGNQELRVEQSNTGKFFYDIYQSFLPLAHKNEIDFKYHIDISTEVWIDQEKLEDVLYNLLANAFRFTPKCRKIELAAKSVTANGKNHLEIIVKDTGCGISPEKLDRLFDRFYQVTQVKNHPNAGTGIGLSLVKSLVEIMHGTINVTSEPGKGSKFRVQLPIDKQEFEQHEIDTTGIGYESELKNKIALLSDQISELQNHEITVHEKGLHKILIVEDNLDMRSYIASVLSKYFTVFEADNGKQGYEIAKKEDLSLIISDIMMPEMGGLEFCNKIKNNLYTSHIPVIMLTAKGEPDDYINGFEQGADDYIAKPFNIDILVAKANSIIENRKKIRDKFCSPEEVSPAEITTNSLDGQFFTKVNEIIEKHYTDSTFDVDQFASEMFVSRSQLYKKLKAITDLSANDFINVYRLKKATELLKNDNLQISEIAYTVGFNDPKYFSRIFKKYFKISPSDQRLKKTG
jgi:signal transduction histidine kinase/ligand-binding sensor domain-containing protein/DNA-binding response OmpR family regulator